MYPTLPPFPGLSDSTPPPATPHANHVCGGAVAIELTDERTAGYKICNRGSQVRANHPTTVCEIENEWVSQMPETGFTSQYEVFATMETTHGGAVEGSALNTWLNLGASNYSWGYNFLDSNRFTETETDSEGFIIATLYIIGTANLQLKIRKVGTTALLADATFAITISMSGYDSGASNGSGESGPGETSCNAGDY